MTNSEFCYGVALGVVLAGVLAFLLQQIQFQDRRRKAPQRPVRTFPPDDTPAKIVRASREASCLYWLLVGLLLVVAAFFSYVALTVAR
jgi:hypothetical protein